MSEATPKGINAALFAAGADFDTLQTDCRGKDRNEHQSLPGLLSVVRPILRREKILLTQPIEYEEGTGYLITRLIQIESGDRIEAKHKLPEDIRDAQKLGAWLTYMRRQLLQGLLGICPDPDGDGRANAYPQTNSRTAAKQIEEAGEKCRNLLGWWHKQTGSKEEAAGWMLSNYGVLLVQQLPAEIHPELLSALQAAMSERGLSVELPMGPPAMAATALHQ